MRFAHELRARLTNLVVASDDGWVPTESWDAARAIQEESFDRMARRLRKLGIGDGVLRSEQDLRGIWPFDLRS